MPIAVRNSSGVRNDVNADERNVRRYWTARCSTTWVRPATRLLDQRAAGEPQEHVLEGRPPDEHRLGLEATFVGGYRDRLAVVGVEQHPVGQPLDALGEAVELAVERLLDAGREAELGDLPGRVAIDQLARRALGDDLRLVHDD